MQALRWLKVEVKIEDPWDQRQLVFLLEEGALHTRQQHELTTELAKVATTRDEVRLLQSVPGLDYTLALTIVAEAGEIRRFRNRKKFAAYCGLVPKNRASGEKDPQHTKRRHGNPQLTYAFEMAVQAIRKMGRGRFFVLLKALEKRVGVPKAITAVAHRLSFTVYALWKKGALYEETEAKFYSAKRRRLAKRAAEPVEAPSLARAADNLIGQLNHTGATTWRSRPTLTSRDSATRFQGREKLGLGRHLLPKRHGIQDRETGVFRRPPKSGLHGAHLCLGEPPRAPRAIALGETGKALFVKTTDPVLHRARGIPEFAGDVGRDHPLGHQK